MYSFLSLMSEVTYVLVLRLQVGGFLGLLLGASILTVCELLDYITMTIVTRCRNRRKVRPDDKGKD